MDTHRKIFRAVLIVGLFVLLGRVFGAVREIMFAARYGTSEVIDAYVLTFSIVSWPAAVWMSTLTTLAVPLLVRAEAPSAASRFTGELSSISTIIGLALSAAFFLTIWHLAGSDLLGLSPEAAASVREMLAPLSLTLPLGLFISVLSMKLMSEQRHINTLLDGVPALAVSAALLTIVPMPPAHLAWATVTGFALQAAVLACLQTGPTFARPRRLDSPEWRALSKGLGVFVLGQLAVGAIAFLDPIMSAGLGAGAVATLNYANRILALALGITATAVARAVLPAFSELASDPARLAQTAKTWIVGLLFAGAASAAIGWFAAPWIVKLLFERGQFTAADTEAVATTLRFGLLQLPFYLSGIAAVQLLAAQGRQREITRSGLVNVVVKILANLILIGSLGIAGAMLSTAVMYFVSFLVLTRAALHPGARGTVQSS